MRTQLSDGVAWVQEAARTIRYEHVSGRALAFADLECQRSIVWGIDSRLVSYVEGMASVLLAAQLDADSSLLAHAGLLGDGGRGLLVLGATGSGKSTLCLEAIMRCGALYGGDDICLIHLVADKLPTLAPVRRTLCIDDREREWLDRKARQVPRLDYQDLSGRNRNFWLLSNSSELSADDPLPLAGVLLVTIRAQEQTVVETVDPAVLRSELASAIHVSDLVSRCLQGEEIVESIHTALERERRPFFALSMGRDPFSFGEALQKLWVMFRSSLLLVR